MNNLQIHYDCDPGQDDAIALLYALGAGVTFSGISTVGGNVDVQKCTRNTLQLLELTKNTHIPVYTGAPQPLKRMLSPLPEIYGECGMAGANLPSPHKKPDQKTAYDYLAQADLPETFVLTGPLTNIALSLQKNPYLAKKIKRLIIMGGCIYPEKIHGRLGNIQVKNSEEWAEYNFAVDPEAAQIVFAAGFETICLIPLEVTRTVLYNHKIDQDLREIGKPIADIVARMLSTVGEGDLEDYGSLQAFPEDPVRALHDVVAMAYLIEPDLFMTRNLPLRITIDPPPAGAGQTHIDQNNPDHPDVTVITDLNREAFYKNILKYIGNL